MRPEEEGRFSRSGITEGAKCTARVDVPVTADLEEKLIALAVMAGKPRAEFARMLLTKAVEGELAYLRSVGSLPNLGDGRNHP